MRERGKGGVLLPAEYREAKELSARIAVEVGEPLFYRERKEELELSRRLLRSHSLAMKGMEVVREKADSWGHGISHVEKVAVDAGALVIIELSGSRDGAEVRRVVGLVHLAAVLHDIKRQEPDHAERGAEEADRFLREMGLGEGERRAVVQAIRNHEAFKPCRPLDDPSLQILSDALYDADKFRWGPDNFTETVWSMVAPLGVPLAVLLAGFRPGMDGIRKIAGTFRTPTGREYGPDFIARGLEIGERLYAELSERMGA